MRLRSTSTLPFTAFQKGTVSRPAEAVVPTVVGVEVEPGARITIGWPGRETCGWFAGAEVDGAGPGFVSDEAGASAASGWKSSTKIWLLAIFPVNRNFSPF